MQEMNTREREGVLVGVGAGLTLIVLLVLQSLIGTGLLSTRTVTVTSTTTTALSTIPDAYDQVGSAYANHRLLLDSDNISALVSEYERNATIEWTGAAGGLTGNFTGLGTIGIKLRSFTGQSDNFSLSNESQTMGAKGSDWVVNSTFNFYGYSQAEGKINTTITAQDSYAHVGNAWLISRETWNFTNYDLQYPVSAGF